MASVSGVTMGNGSARSRARIGLLAKGMRFDVADQTSRRSEITLPRETLADPGAHGRGRDPLAAVPSERGDDMWGRATRPTQGFKAAASGVEGCSMTTTGSP